MTTTKVSDSMRRTAACDFRWLLSYGLGLTQPVKPSAMFRGIVWGKAMDAYHGRILDGKGLDPARKALQDELAKVPAGHDGDQHTPADAVEIISQALETLERYHFHYLQAESWNTWHRVTGAEVSLTFNATTFGRSGRQSPNLKITGKLDKVMEDDHGRIWAGEHKFTGHDLTKWRQLFGYRPQASTYGWLLSQKFPNKTVAGVIYDLAQSKTPRPWTELKLVKDGSRMRGQSGLPFTTSLAWKHAMKFHGIWESDHKGRDVYEQLKDRDSAGFWFRREVVPFHPGEIERVGAELFYVARKIHVMKRKIAPDSPLHANRFVNLHRQSLKAWIGETSGKPVEMAKRVSTVLTPRVVGAFPRNPNECTGVGGSCPYRELCSASSSSPGMAATLYVPKEWRD